MVVQPEKMGWGERGTVFRILASDAIGPGFKSRLGQPCWDFSPWEKMSEIDWQHL